MMSCVCVCTVVHTCSASTSTISILVALEIKLFTFDKLYDKHSTLVFSIIYNSSSLFCLFIYIIPPTPPTPHVYPGSTQYMFRIMKVPPVQLHPMNIIIVHMKTCHSSTANNQAHKQQQKQYQPTHSHSQCSWTTFWCTCTATTQTTFRWCVCFTK
jgi:hypothetical protein